MVRLPATSADTDAASVWSGVAGFADFRVLNRSARTATADPSGFGSALKEYAGGSASLAFHNGPLTGSSTGTDAWAELRSY